MDQLAKFSQRGFALYLQFFVTFFLNGLVRKKLRKLPSSFNKFPSARIIIDCTEIFFQKPISPQA